MIVEGVVASSGAIGPPKEATLLKHQLQCARPRSLAARLGSPRPPVAGWRFLRSTASVALLAGGSARRLWTGGGASGTAGAAKRVACSMRFLFFSMRFSFRRSFRESCLLLAWVAVEAPDLSASSSRSSSFGGKRVVFRFLARWPPPRGGLPRIVDGRRGGSNDVGGGGAMGEGGGGYQGKHAESSAKLG